MSADCIFCAIVAGDAEASVVAESERALALLDIQPVTPDLFIADGEAAVQDVLRVHLHVLPRPAGDGFGLRFPPDYRVRDRAELDAVAERLREAWT